MLVTIESLERDDLKGHTESITNSLPAWFRDIRPEVRVGTKPRAFAMEWPIRSWLLFLTCFALLVVSYMQLHLAQATHHECFTPPMTFPLTWAQSILASNSSSTRPHAATFSPRMRYSPWGTSALDSGSSWGRITRSIVWPSTRFVTWSQDNKVPVRVRPSAVRIRTFSGENSSGNLLALAWHAQLTIDVWLEWHVSLCFWQR